MGTESSLTRRYSLSYFTLFAMYGVVSPYLQILVRGLGYGPAAVGLFLALFEIVGILGPIFLARRADASSKRKPALVAAAFCILGALPSLVLIRQPLVTAVSIALLAIGVKTVVPVMDSAAVAFLASGAGNAGGAGNNGAGKAGGAGNAGGVGGGGRARGTKGYGSLRVMGSLGFIAVALLLQAIPGFDRSPPWGIALWIAGTTALALVCLAFLPEAAAPARGEDRGSRERRRFDPLFALGLVIIGFGRFAMAPVNSFVSLYATEYLKLDAVGGLWALAAATEVPIMLVAGAVIMRIGPMAAIAISTAAVATRLAVCALFPTAGGLVAAQLLHSLCYGLFQPAAVAFVAGRVPPERRSSGMAIYMGFGVGLPAVLGSALGGFVVEAAGYRWLFAAFIPFALASLAIQAATTRRFARG